MSWYYTSAGVRMGPISKEELQALALSGRLMMTDLVWSEGMATWQPASSIPGLLPLAPAGPPPFPSAHPAASYPPPPYPPPPAATEDPALRWVLPVGRSGLAIAAGYLGIFSLLGIFAPFAILTGVLALREIKKNPRLGGRGRAIFGIVMGSLFTLLIGAAILISMFSK